MPEDNIEYQQPVTDDIYFFMSRCGTQYLTLLVSPLLPHWLHPQPMVLSMTIGEHRFMAKTDKSMFLIPYKSPYCVKYAEHIEQIDLFPSGQVPKGMEELRYLKMPYALSLSITPYLKFKIDTDGKLYKREGDSWNPVQIST